MIELGIKFMDLLQNLLMHVFVSSQTHHKVYEKLGKKGPDESSSRFMAEVVSAEKKRKALLQHKKKKEEEYVWQTAPRPQTKRGPPPGNRGRRDNEPMKCFKCGKEGHTRRECSACSFCRASDHTAKTCQKRIAQAKGKYCSFCKLKDSHDSSECRRRPRRSGGRNIREVRPSDEADDKDYEYDSNIFEASPTSEDSDSDTY